MACHCCDTRRGAAGRGTRPWHPRAGGGGGVLWSWGCGGRWCTRWRGRGWRRWCSWGTRCWGSGGGGRVARAIRARRQGVGRGDRAGLSDEGRALVALTSDGLEAAFAAEDGMACSSLRHRGEELLGDVTRARHPRRPVDVGHPAAAPVGQPARRLRLRSTTARPSRSRRARRRSTSKSTGCRCTGCATRPAAGTVLEPASGASSPAASSTGAARVPVRPPRRGRRGADRHDADADDDRHRDRRAAGADRLRLPPVPAAARRAAGRLGDHAAGQRPADGRRAPRADRRARARRRPRRPARRRAPSTTASRSTSGAGRSSWRAAAAGSRSPSSPATPTPRSSRPAIADVICFEPMTAPADALRHSPGAVAPGESFSARFSVSVSPAA